MMHPPTLEHPHSPVHLGDAVRMESNSPLDLSQQTELSLADCSSLAAAVWLVWGGLGQTDLAPLTMP